MDTQLIAHDKEVYDIAWGGPEVFASVSADGSVRVFDLRDKDHSTILYESPKPDTPLLRLGWNKQNPRYMATMEMDSKVVVLDIRFPTLPVEELQRHSAPVNTLAWAPHSSCHICTVRRLAGAHLGPQLDVAAIGGWLGSHPRVRCGGRGVAAALELVATGLDRHSFRQEHADPSRVKRATSETSGEARRGPRALVGDI